MPVNDLHPMYIEKQYEVKQMRDTLAGPSRVKSENSLYLPIPASMAKNSSKQPETGISYNTSSKKDDMAMSVPWRHSIPAYQSYLQRARFPDITALMLRGMTGLSLKKYPTIEMPKSIEYLEKRATRDGKSVHELFAFMLGEVLSVGRFSMLVDVDDKNGQLVIVPYVTESLTNWKQTRIDGDDKFSLVVFRESSQKTDDEFSHDCKNDYLVVRNSAKLKGGNGDLIDASVYSVEKYNGDSLASDGGIIVPMLRGVPFKEIPVVVVNVDGTGTGNWSCPLVGVSDIALSIYQKDADMSNSEFVTCNPMLVFTGVDSDSDDVPDIIGSSVTWTLPDPQSKAFYVEPQSTCLEHMSKRIADLFDEAVQYGVSVLGAQRNGAEAAETVKMRQASNGSNLRTIIRSCSEALKDILEFCEAWETGKVSGEVEIETSLELTEMNLTPQELTALLQSWLNGAISHETYLSRLSEGGFKLAGETPEGEMDKIATDGPSLDNIDDNKDGSTDTTNTDNTNDDSTED